MRSNSPALVDLDFQRAVANCGGGGSFDPNTLEVFALSTAANPSASGSAPNASAPIRVPHHLEGYFGTTQMTLHFVIPNHACTIVAVYFDTAESGRGKPKSFHGLVGDGDRFCERYQRRDIAASHFDCFADFDGDGDLDLFQGGVEPYVYCYENIGGNRFMDRGRLSSGDRLFTLPCSRSNRSWVTVAFYDVDGDGDLDFFPSFGDGPDAGKIIYYRNTTREHGAQLTFSRVGPLQTVSGTLLAGGPQAGGWFPSITFVPDWDGDGLGPDALVGSANRCWLYRGLSSGPAATPGKMPPPSGNSRVRGQQPTILPLPKGEGRGEGEGIAPRFADAVPVQAGGKDIELVNPRFVVADVDADGDLDLFAGTQPGPVFWFKNIGTGTRPELAPGKVIAWDGKYLIGDAHSGVNVGDFDSDGLPDIVSGRFWERADLNAPGLPRHFGGFFRNTGTRTSPRFESRSRGSPFTEQFQICDAVRQNCVRAADWDGDGRLDLLAGDTDGSIWLFKNTLRRSGQPNAPAPSAFRIPHSEIKARPLTPVAAEMMWSVFAAGERLQAGGKLLSVGAGGGHARFDMCDWNNDGRLDLVVADGSGTVTLFLSHGPKSKPALAAGQKIFADGKPIQLGPRSSALVCDWDNDGRKDLVLADEKGYFFSRNVGTDAAPLLGTPKPILFGGRRVNYVRPNLGSFADWDGDGKRDLIGCQFENSIRFYRNIGSGAPGEQPQFADPEGVVLLQAESPQMISGVEVADWNGDGDLDLLTGQGHGGSGLRFYERDWIEDNRLGTHPVVTVRRVESKPGRP